MYCRPNYGRNTPPAAARRRNIVLVFLPVRFPLSSFAELISLSLLIDSGLCGVRFPCFYIYARQIMSHLQTFHRAGSFIVRVHSLLLRTSPLYIL